MPLHEVRVKTPFELGLIAGRHRFDNKEALRCPEFQNQMDTSEWLRGELVGYNAAEEEHAKETKV